MIDRVPEELWMEVRDKELLTEGSRPSPGKRSAKRQNDCLRRPYKYVIKDEKQKEKEKRKSISI